MKSLIRRRNSGNMKSQLQDNLPSTITQASLKLQKQRIFLQSTSSLLLLSRSILPPTSILQCLHKVWFTALLCTLLLTSNNISVNAQSSSSNNAYHTCYTDLAAADSNNDSILTRDEYVTAVKYISNAYVDATSFDNLSAQLQGGYTFRATTNGVPDSTNGNELYIQGIHSIASTSDTSMLDLLCSSIYAGLVEAMNITTTQQQCFLGMAVSDIDRNNLIQKDTEFPRLVKQLAGSTSNIDVTSFDTLPVPVQQVFEDFANTQGYIDVNGSKPGSSITADEQSFLSNLCRQLTVSIVAGSKGTLVEIPGSSSSGSSSGTTTTTTTTTPAPVAASTPVTPSPTTLKPTTPSPTNTPASSSSSTSATTPTVSSSTTSSSSTFTPSFTYQVCKTAMLVSDLSRDDLLNQDEYLRFINRLSSNKYISATFDTLPAALVDNYATLSALNSSGQISIAGSKPYEPATTEQDAELQSICTSTDMALQKAASSTGTTSSSSGTTPAATAAPVSTTTTTAAPTSKSTNAPTSTPASTGQTTSGSTGGTTTSTTTGQVPQIPLVQCTYAMVTSDTDRSGSFNQNEYLTFLNKITSNKYQGLDYTALPESLQAAFDDLSKDSADATIDISGSRPGTTPTADEEANLERICTETATAIATGDGGTSTAAIEATSAPSGSNNSTIDNSNATETAGTTSPIGNIFDGNSSTDTSSTVAPTSSHSETSFSVYNSFIVSNTAGLNANTITSGKDFDGLLKGYESFVLSTLEHWLQNQSDIGTTNNTSMISNQTLNENATTTSITNSDGSNSTNPDVLGAANDYVAGSTTMAPGTNQTTRRQLLVENIVSDSVSLYQFADTACPSSVTDFGALCQIAYGKFDVTYTNEDKKSLKSLAKQISDFQQNQIVSSDNNAGGLQAFVVAANPDTQIKVVQPSNPVAPSDSTSNGSSKSNDSSSGNNQSGGGISMGIVIGCAIGFLVVFVIAAYFVWKRCWGGGKSSGTECCNCLPLFSLPSSGKGKKKSSKDPDDSQNEEMDREEVEKDGKYMGTGFGQFKPEQAAAQIPPKSLITNLFGGSNRSSHTPSAHADDEESGGFSIQEQDQDSQSGSSKSETDDPDEFRDRATSSNNVFGSFGKKGKNKKNNQFNDSFGNLNDNGAFNENGADDFAKYTFEEPTMANKSKDNVTMNQNDNGFFTSPGPNWNATMSPDDFGNNSWGEKSPAFEPGPAGSLSGSSRSESDGHSIDDDMSRSYDNEEDESESSESDTYYGEDDFTKATRESQTRAPNKVPDNMRHLDSMVENGDWDGVMAAAAQFGNNDDRLSDGVSDPSQASDYGDDNNSASDSYTSGKGNESGSQGESSASSNNSSLNSQDRNIREQYRLKVEALVRKVVPDEMDNVSAMMDQFAGREAELLNTLQTMYQRTSTQRARKAVHKSKAMPKDSSRFSSGGTDGPAAIAAASTIGGGIDARSSPRFEEGSGSRLGFDSQGSGSRFSAGSGGFSGHDLDELSGSNEDDEEDDESYDMDRNPSFAESRDQSFDNEDDAHDRDQSFADATDSYGDDDINDDEDDDEGSYSDEGEEVDEGRYRHDVGQGDNYYDDEDGEGSGSYYSDDYDD